MNWFKRKKRQTTFCCPNCKTELISSGSFVSDNELVKYNCTTCETVTEWLFDAPAPILITVNGINFDYKQYEQGRKNNEV